MPAQQGGYFVEIIARNVAPKADGLTNNGPAKVAQSVHLAVLNPTDADADVLAGLQYQFDTNGDGVYDTAWLSNPYVDVTFPAEGIFTVKAHIRDKDLGVSPDYFRVMFAYPLTRLALGLAATLVISGFLVMRRLASVDA